MTTKKIDPWTDYQRQLITPQAQTLAALIAQFIAVSGNPKTGPIPVLNYPRRSCPISCALRVVIDPKTGEEKAGPCYAAAAFYTRLNWDHLDAGTRGESFPEAMQKVQRLPRGSLVRDKVMGDEYPLAADPKKIDPEPFNLKLRAFKGKRLISYTHHEPNAHNLKLLRKAAALGLHINLSADDLREADKKARHGLPVVAVVSNDTPKVSSTPQGRKVVICPAQTSDRVTCATCALCADGGRDYVIGFRAHGGGRKKIEARLAGVTA